MTLLTSEAFAAARAFVMAHGRPLDQARFAFHFENASGSQVIQALADYQNDDGGFGHALEPDLRTPASSAIATATGLAVLCEAGADGQEPLVKAAVSYLLSTVDRSRKVWPIVPPAVEDAPHAPWWSYAESEDAFDGFIINPRASLIGHLYHFTAGEGAPGVLLDQITPALMDSVEAVPDRELGMHDFLTILELAEADNVPARLRQTMVDKLRAAAPHAVAMDPERWSEYVLQPLQVAPSPDALLAADIDRLAIEANLDYLIERQMDDGAWELGWSWAFVDADAWAKAEREWKGFHAVNHLRCLIAYGRVAGR